MLAPEVGGGVAMTFAGTKVVFAKEDVEATAQRLEDIAGALSQSMFSNRSALFGDPAGAEEASALAVSNLRASANSLAARVAESRDQLLAAAANMRANSTAYTNSDNLTA